MELRPTHGEAAPINSSWTTPVHNSAWTGQRVGNWCCNGMTGLINVADNLAGINKVEKCSGHVDGGAKYCCDIGKGDKKCKCDADVFTIYASTTPIKTIAIPQPTYARLYNPPPASLSNSTTSASGSLTSISQYNAYRPRSLPTSTVSPDFSGNGHSDNQSQWCHNAPSAYLGGAIVLVFALIMFAVLCVLGARQRRLSKQRGACYNSIAETHYNDLKEGADPLPSETRISDT